jgi:hypothetical protein
MPQPNTLPNALKYSVPVIYLFRVYFIKLLAQNTKCKMNSESVRMWKGRSWPNFTGYLDICLEGQRRTTKKLCQSNWCSDRYSNPVSPEYTNSYSWSSAGISKEERLSWASLGHSARNEIPRLLRNLRFIILQYSRQSNTNLYPFLSLALQPSFGPRPTSMKLSVSLWFTRS